ncbi:MAG TPA: DUF882 domain-containing protein [Caulobacteraceae bacterium]|jgi:uncharacterized protein YcbK (DUF882 family)
MAYSRRTILKGGFGLTAAAAAVGAAPLALATGLDTGSDPIGDLINKQAPAGTLMGGSSGVLGGPAAAMLGDSARRLAFDNLHTGEKLDVAYWENGTYVPDALQAVNHVLRDHYNNEVHIIEPRLLDLLTALSRKMEAMPNFEVISGYRSPSTNAMLHAESSEVAVSSLHMLGQAIDIRMTDRNLAYLHLAALELGDGGVGYYPMSDFVHVDVGRVRHWGGT